jgi:hypothetical protein
MLFSPVGGPQPVEGDISHCGLLLELHVPLLSTVIPTIDVFVKTNGVLIQETVSGEIEKFASGFTDVVIGSIVDSENPHGFIALILT